MGGLVMTQHVCTYIYIYISGEGIHNVCIHVYEYMCIYVYVSRCLQIIFFEGRDF